MDRPPRKLKAPLLSAPVILKSVIQGLVSLFSVLAVYFYMVFRHASDADTRSVAFTTLVLSNLALIVVNLIPKGSLLGKKQIFANRPFWFVMIVAIFSLLLVLYTSFFNEIFKLSPIHSDDLLLVILATTLQLVLFLGYNKLIINK